MSVSAGENWIKVPKCKPIKARIHREITGTVKSITLTKTPTGKFYAFVLAEGLSVSAADEGKRKSSTVLVAA